MYRYDAFAAVVNDDAGKVENRGFVAVAVNVYRQVFGNNHKGSLFVISFFNCRGLFVVINIAVFEHCRAIEHGVGVGVEFLSPSAASRPRRK